MPEQASADRTTRRRPAQSRYPHRQNRRRGLRARFEVDEPENDGSGQTHGLTETQLKAAEASLQNMPAAARPAGRSRRIVARREEHVRGLGIHRHRGRGKRAGISPARSIARERRRRLVAHDDCHSDTVLRVWTEADTIEYQCDVPFEIVQVERAGWRIYDAPEIPFDEKGRCPTARSESNVPRTETRSGYGRQASCPRRLTTNNTRWHSRSSQRRERRAGRS